MPSASEFSLTPDANLTIGGVNVAEGCSPAGLNNVARYLAAAARDTYDRLPDTSTYMPKAGGVFTGGISYNGRGSFLHHANAAQTDGRLYIVPEGTARPATPAEGMVIFYYA